ncbi:MAG: GNAT family N-acetyltransferase [Polyangiaceae bacterium]
MDRSIRVRPLEEGETTTAVLTLRDAFMHDPLFRWLLPEEASCSTWLEWFHRFSIAQCAPLGGAFTLEPGGPASGAMALVPPGGWPLSLWSTLRAIPFPRRAPTKRLAVAGLKLLKRMSDEHPVEPHVYLSVIGVAPENKGKGLGGALLRHVTGLADAAELPAYLETGNPDNLPLYERFGFRVERTIEEHGGPPLWTMRRPTTPR